MIVTDKIASVYAQALLELARDGSALGEIDEELSTISTHLQQDAGVWAFFKSPLMSGDEKIKIFEKVLKNNINGILYNFIGVLARKRRLGELPAISIAFRALLDRELGRRRVSVQTALEPEQSLVESMKKTLSGYFGTDVVLELKVNPEIIGGLVIQSDDLLIDTSVKQGLENMRRALLKRKLVGEEYYEN